MILKVWAIKKGKTFSDSKEVKQGINRFDIGYFPQLIHVILLDANSGEKLDEFRNFASIEEKYLGITPESIKIAIRKGEGETTEFKEQIPNDLGKHLVALANTIGGQIIIGVDNEGQPVGVKEVRKEADRAQQIAGACNPPIKIQTDIIKIENKDLLVISIPKSKHELLHQFRGIIYVRRGATTGRASPIEIKEMQDRQKSPYL